MKVVVAIDSLKGSLSSIQAGHAVKQGILSACPDAKVVVKPLADGGEGTTDSLIEGLGGTRIDLQVTGPLGSSVSAYYGYLEESKTAVLEMASAAGITLVPETQKDPLAATTYGVGEMILNALHRGCRKFIIGIGGSATNDGGLGMLKALGYRFLDREGNDLGEGAQALSKIASISTEHVDPLLADCEFQVACDVTNPLCGPNGATYIYGPQKGVTEEMKAPLDAAMEHYAKISEQATRTQFANTPGAGAAGGLGFAFLSYLNATLVPGIDLILDAIHLEKEIQDADVVVTGEGRLDHQTAMGKAPIGVARIAKKYGAVVVAFAGSVTRDASACNQAGIDAFFSIVRGITTLEEAMDPANTGENLSLTAEQVFRLISVEEMKKSAILL